MYPQLRLHLPRLEANIAATARWCSAAGADWWPHIKTTMCRPVVERQLAAGASVVTVATVGQAAIAAHWGCARLLVANEVVNPADLDQLARLARSATVMLLVDSAAGIAAADKAAVAAGVRLNVFVDVGRPGGRTGVRDARAAVDVAQRVRAARGLRLVGVSAYEGAVPPRRDEQTLQIVDEHCRLAAEVFLDVIGFADTGTPVFTAGGSAFPDRVLEACGPVRAVPGAMIALRPGCSTIHDHGLYERVSPIPGLAAAVTIRGQVLSAPEAGLVVVGAGKRDLPYDADLPTVVGAWDPKGRSRKGGAAEVTELYDHHAVLRVEEAGPTVGDLVDFGVSHPCGAFDRWPTITVVDDDGSVLDEWSTQFR
ncbi:MAG: alanine racemase [Gordonia sp. (in: high G+C Gram-positive bacteria)]|uniref:alanine racemase n=1 Tax=Gordonia sp. (in: high G+C Gram-positive bacteria) TaxID=84139 RepID=UPI0039E2DD95